MATQIDGLTSSISLNPQEFTSGMQEAAGSTNVLIGAVGDLHNDFVSLGATGDEVSTSWSRIGQVLEAASLKMLSAGQNSNRAVAAMKSVESVAAIAARQQAALGRVGATDGTSGQLGNAQSLTQELVAQQAIERQLARDARDIEQSMARQSSGQQTTNQLLQQRRDLMARIRASQGEQASLEKQIVASINAGAAAHQQVLATLRQRQAIAQPELESSRQMAREAMAFQQALQMAVRTGELNQREADAIAARYRELNRLARERVQIEERSSRQNAIGSDLSRVGAGAAAVSLGLRRATEDAVQFHQRLEDAVRAGDILPGQAQRLANEYDSAFQKMAASSSRLSGGFNKVGFAVQQATFGVEDFFSQFTTRGFGPALAAASNNLTFLAFQVSTIAGVGAAATAGALQIANAYFRIDAAAEEAAKEIEDFSARLTQASQDQIEFIRLQGQINDLLTSTPQATASSFAASAQSASFLQVEVAQYQKQLGQIAKVEAEIQELRAAGVPALSEGAANFAKSTLETLAGLTGQEESVARLSEAHEKLYAGVRRLNMLEETAEERRKRQLDLQEKLAEAQRKLAPLLRQTDVAMERIQESISGQLDTERLKLEDHRAYTQAIEGTTAELNSQLEAYEKLRSVANDTAKSEAERGAASVAAAEAARQAERLVSDRETLLKNQEKLRQEGIRAEEMLRNMFMQTNNTFSERERFENDMLARREKMNAALEKAVESGQLSTIQAHQQRDALERQGEVLREQFRRRQQLEMLQKRQQALQEKLNEAREMAVSSVGAVEGRDSQETLQAIESARIEQLNNNQVDPVVTELKAVKEEMKRVREAIKNQKPVRVGTY